MTNYFLLGLVIGQNDNDQILGVTHEQRAYNKQHLTIVNANSHIICDKTYNFLATLVTLCTEISPQRR